MLDGRKKEKPLPMMTKRKRKRNEKSIEIGKKYSVHCALRKITVISMWWCCCWYFFLFAPPSLYLCSAIAKGHKTKRMHFQLWRKKMCIWWLKIFLFFLSNNSHTAARVCMGKWKSGCKRNPFEEKGKMGAKAKTHVYAILFSTSFHHSDRHLKREYVE